jgi:hypothetical protein
VDVELDSLAALNDRPSECSSALPSLSVMQNESLLVFSVTKSPASMFFWSTFFVSPSSHLALVGLQVPDPFQAL